MAPAVDSNLNRAYNDKFLFSANLPDALKNVKNRYIQLAQESGITRDVIDFSLIGVNIPTITTRSENLKYAGSSVNVSTHTRDPYDPLTIKFTIDNRYSNYLTIYTWLNFIYDANAGYFDSHNLSKTHDITSYQCNISVTALNDYQEPVIQWIFTHAYPSKLDALEYDYQKGAEIPCSATFEFAQMFVRQVAFDKLKLKNLDVLEGRAKNVG